MKTGLRIRRKCREVYAFWNIFRFFLKKTIFGFEVANIFIQRVDKASLQKILKNNGASIGENCDLESGMVFHNCNNYNNLIIGSNCHIGKNCFFDLREKIQIYDNVVISMKVTFITHIDLGRSPLSAQYPATSEAIFVKHGAYIGANSTILMGVSVGNNSFIAAGALVRDNVNDYSLVAGIPAKEVKLISID